MKLLFLSIFIMTLAFSKDAPLDNAIQSTQNFLKLTDAQKKYIENKKELKMCVNPNWMPIEKIQNGGHIGMAADIIREVSQKLEMSILLVPTSEWSESLSKIRKRECDILAIAQETPERKKYLNFTTPYINTPLVIATEAGMHFMGNLDVIKHHELGIVKNNSMYELLMAKYPSINLISLSSIQEGLDLVQQKKIFGFLDNFIVASHEIKKQDIKDVAVTGQFKDMFELSIASRNDEPILGEILELALFSIPQNTRNEIIYRWSHITHETKLDHKLIGEILFFGFALLSIFIYWNLQLKDEIKKRKEAEEELKKSEEKFRTLFDIAPIFMNSFDKNGQVKMWNKKCEETFGWNIKELQKTKNPLGLFYPDINEQERFFKTTLNKESNNFEEWYPITKNKDVLITKWANVYLSNDEVIHIGYNITKERQNRLDMEEKTQLLKNATQQLEDLNRDLEIKIKIEVEKNAKNQLFLMEKNKLAQMGEMIENIAHQWRQPLAEVNSLVLLIDQHLTHKNFYDDIIEEKLSSIENLTHHMSKTIDNFKNFFNPNKKQQRFFLHQIVQDTLLIIKGSTQYNYIDIIVDIDETLECNGYPYELQEVLLILLNNARDALIQNKIKEPEIQIKLTKENNEYILSIYDNAGGIANKLLDKIFQPYFTTKYKKQGAGIGLYMARIIVEERLQGKLEVKNTLLGACFIINFLKGGVSETN